MSSSHLEDEEEERTALLSQEMDKDDSIEHAEVATASHLHVTNSALRHGDRALAIIGDERVTLTDEDNRRIRRKTDFRILTILIWVYFLQGMLVG